MNEYGKIYMNLERLIKKKRINKTPLSYLCRVLEYKLSDLIIYELPKG